MAIMLYANFRFAGEAQARAKGHPEWDANGEWQADPDCFERALATLVRSVWQHHPKAATGEELLTWLQDLTAGCSARN